MGLCIYDGDFLNFCSSLPAVFSAVTLLLLPHSQGNIWLFEDSVLITGKLPGEVTHFIVIPVSSPVLLTQNGSFKGHYIPIVTDLLLMKTRGKKLNLSTLPSFFFQHFCFIIKKLKTFTLKRLYEFVVSVTSLYFLTDLENIQLMKKKLWMVKEQIRNANIYSH